MLIGVVGKPNAGKSTFFAAASLAPAEIADYPFTTIKPNRGVAYVTHPCPHLDVGTACEPNNAPCREGTRLVPIDLLDVAGLVPDAHQGRGLGNQFLDDLRQASALVHVVDASGGTDGEGNPVAVGEHDPREDIDFLEMELAYWIAGILGRDWVKTARRAESEGVPLEKLLAERVAGLGLKEGHVQGALREARPDGSPRQWGETQLRELAHALRRVGMPMVIAANKADITPPEAMERLTTPGRPDPIPTCSECELALRRAAQAGLVEYLPGASSFRIHEAAALTAAQRDALQRIEAHLKRFGSTGVQAVLEGLVYETLGRLVVFPVEDENHWTDKDGHVLPDAYLMPPGSKARDLAYRVHTDLGENFIRAINARTKRVVGQEYELQDGDVIRVVART